jgi:hypothetical protein
MAKEQVFIVMSHKHSFNKDKQWETAEAVEFVSQLRNRHFSYASVIGDYINKKLVGGSKSKLISYEKFEDLVRTKYADQMAELDKAYRDDIVEVEVAPTAKMVTDQFDNARPWTVFDPA